MKRPCCIGLTGGLGSGKSTVAACFAALGAGVVDTDVISRELTAAGGAALADVFRAFGQSYRQADGGLDRRRLRERIFADEDARHVLEGILHPRIHAEAARRVVASTAPYVLLVVPLLVETGSYADLLDRVLVVDCDPVRQVERAMSRDKMTEVQALAMLAAQATRAARLAMADDVLDNSGPQASLVERVRQLHAQYLELAKKT